MNHLLTIMLIVESDIPQHSVGPYWDGRREEAYRAVVAYRKNVR